MGSVLVIARKEFGDLLSSRIIIVTMAVYLLLVSYSVYGFYMDASANRSMSLLGSTVGSILYVLTGYGSIIGVVIGVVSISKERSNSALNVLVSKPLYRDTIINGKLIGSVLFLACMFCLVIAFYTSGLFLLCGSTIAQWAFDYVIRLPVAFFISLVYVMIFMSLAMFISTLIKDQAFATIMSVIAWDLIEFIRNAAFADNLAWLLTRVFSWDYNSVNHWIGELSPGTIIFWISNNRFFEPELQVMNVPPMEVEVAKLLVFLVAAVVVCYIGFVRSDVS